MGDYEQVLTPEDDGFLCPTCSVKRTRSTQRSLRPEHMRMLLTADRGIESQIGPLLRSESTVRICRTCKTQADQALAAAMTTYKTPSFETTDCKRKSPVVLQAALRVKSYPNPVDLFKAILKGKHELDITILGKQPLFLVGSVVEVSRRMQPYVNEEGGIAHVTRVAEDTSDGGLGFLYDVTYVLRNRQEKELPESFLCESSEMLPKKRRVSVDSSALSIEGTCHYRGLYCVRLGYTAPSHLV